MHKLIFDIGSNQFKFTDACRKQFPDCVIVAVDPIFEIYEHYNSSIHNGKLIYLSNIVSDKDGAMEIININGNETGMSTVSKHYMHNSRFAKGNKSIIKQYYENCITLQKTSPEIVNSEVFDWLKRIDFTSQKNFEKTIITEFGSMSNYLSRVHLYTSRAARTITLDKMITTYGEPDLIKVDVEGYESVVIKGLTNKAKKICFEWCEEMDNELYSCLELLENLGYKEFGILGYFEEGDKYNFLTYNESGDVFLMEPKYFAIEQIKTNLKQCINPQRRINWGMAWAK